MVSHIPQIGRGEYGPPWSSNPHASSDVFDTWVNFGGFGMAIESFISMWENFRFPPHDAWESMSRGLELGLALYLRRGTVLKNCTELVNDHLQVC